MDSQARHAVRTIRRSIKAGRYRLMERFTHRMDQRGVTWPDVLALLDAPTAVRFDGADRWGRDRWIIGGEAADGLPMEVVCVLDEASGGGGTMTVFITIDWKD